MITKKYALLCLHPVKLFLYFGHSAAPNPQNNYISWLVLCGRQGPASVGMGVVGIVAKDQR